MLFDDYNRSICVYRYRFLFSPRNTIFCKKCIYCLCCCHRHATIDQDITLIRNEKKILKPIVKERNTQFVRLAEPSVITTSTDAREWKDQSSKRQIDMSLIRHDGHVLSSRKRCIRTHAGTFATFAYARAFTSILQRPQAHPRYSLMPTLYVVYVRMCARAAGGIYHCATNFRDKYFTDGHYAGIRVFARYKLWM